VVDDKPRNKQIYPESNTKLNTDIVMDNFRHSSEVKTNESTNNKPDNPKKVIRIGLDFEL